MKLFSLKELKPLEAGLAIALSTVFLVATGIFIGLRPDHILLIALFLVMFFASPASRRLAVALLPFMIFGISYDWMRIKPNYEVNPIDIRGIYEQEKLMFGITADGVRMIPGEYFNLHNWKVCDFLAGVFYLCWVPVPILFGLWLYFKGERKWYLRFSLAFLFVNLLGFSFYYVHPAAPPWYVINYGFEPHIHTPGNIAGLARFQELTGLHVFDGLYSKNSNVFAAVPSLHAAYMLIAFIYAIKSKQSWWMISLFGVITVGIWATAVYSCHHYVIDVILGILTAIVGIFIFEKLLLRIGSVSRALNRYVSYITK